MHPYFTPLPPPFPSGKRPVSGLRIPADHSSCFGNSNNHCFQRIQCSIKMPCFEPPAAGFFDTHRGALAEDHTTGSRLQERTAVNSIPCADAPQAFHGLIFLFREKFPQATSTQRHLPLKSSCHIKPSQEKDILTQVQY
ncbi:MAG: hypothetical protein ACTFAL_03405 [Candidatus Electronema sp. V4]|uniref:hypothetical protein n=1 Tax=Candidatus Electronema sp. V4 TaxID=3454756 RepID=UPI00405562E4